MYIPVNFDNSITPREMDMTPTTFKALNLQEHHLEEYVRRNVGEILENETLLIVGRQVRNTSGGISDLTAVDDSGNVVLIEIKRDLNDMTHRAEALEFQAIRYAAGYAKIKQPEELVDLVFSRYIEQHRREFHLGDLTPAERARRDLNKFLQENDSLRTFNQKQRIFLLAAAFDIQTLSAVAWLIGNGVDINCISVTPIITDQGGFLQVERVLPLGRLDDFYVDPAAGSGQSVGTKTTSRSRRKASGRAYLPRMDQLFEWKLIVPGDLVYIKNYPESKATALDPKRVSYQDQELTYSQWGKLITDWSAINVYEWTILESAGRTLDDLRAEKLAEIEANPESLSILDQQYSTLSP